jgi:hypothetical protein
MNEKGYWAEGSDLGLQFEDIMSTLWFPSSYGVQLAVSSKQLAFARKHTYNCTYRQLRGEMDCYEQGQKNQNGGRTGFR